jgi:hypothetical protein
LGSDWKQVIDYVFIHPFYKLSKKNIVEIYKEIQSNRGIFLVGSPLFYYIDPMKDSKIPLLLDLKKPLYVNQFFSSNQRKAIKLTSSNVSTTKSDINQKQNSSKRDKTTKRTRA